MQGRELRRSVTLLEQLAVADSYHLRGLLRVRDEDEDEVHPGAAAAGDKREDSAGRTLLDIIREEQVANAVVVNGNSGNGINWKSLKDLLRLRRAGAAWASSSSSGQPYHLIADQELVVSVRRPNPVLARSVSIRNSELPVPESTSGHGAIEYNPEATDDDAAAVPAAAPPEEHPSGVVGNEEATVGGESSNLGGATAAPASTSATGAAEEEQPVRVSLMALLEQTDGQWGSGEEGSSPAAALAAVEDVAEDEAEEGGGGMLYVCCVCLVRNKGAAFIPCGHTFCRLCSRELWVSRGNCPLCNGLILEILDIF